MLFRFHSHFTVLLISTLVLAGCGGGGGSSSPTSPPQGGASPPASDFVPGVFADSRVLAAQCINPRSGLDHNGIPFLDVQGTALDENQWIRSYSNETYLWYDEIIDIDPAGYGNPLVYFDLMVTPELSPTGNPKDKFHFTYSTEEFYEEVEAGILAGYGVTFSITSYQPPREVVVAYTELNSPATASEVNLLRGARILEVDGVDLVNVRSDAGIDIFLAGLFPDDIDEDHEFVIQDLNSSETRVISMRSALITWNPVPVVDTIDTTAGKVGYVVFNDHIPASEQKLIDAVSQLNTSVVNDLILDLRYNVGGYLDIASEMAYMIVGPSTAGRTFEKLEFNDKLSYLDETTLFHSEAYGFSADEGLPLPSLDLPRVFVLTSADTCSASEAIINSLRGIGIEVVQIGDTTCGKPYGFAFDGENCGTIYFTIQFRGVNEAGFGDYTDGFSPEDAGLDGTPVPGCFVLDDFTHALGDVEEAQLAAALYYREFGECPTTNSASRLSRSSPDNPLSRSRGTIMKPDWLKNRILTPRNHGLRFGTVP